MNKQDDDQIARVDALLQTKAFGELTEAERQLVLGHFASEEAYENARHLMPFIAEQVENDEPAFEPDPAILTRVRHTYDLKTDPQKIKKQGLGGTSLLALFSLKGLILKGSFALVAAWGMFSLDQGANLDDMHHLTDTVSVSGEVWQDSCCTDSSSLLP